LPDEALELQTIKLQLLASWDTCARELHSHSHAAHAAAHAAAFTLFVLDVSDHCFGGEHQTGDRSRVLQGSAGDFRGIDDAGCDEIFVVLGRLNPSFFSISPRTITGGR
jgi:hypothetical protein